MKLEQIRLLLEEAARLTNHRQFVVVGSLSVLGALLDAPPRMVQSIDVDFFPKLDPARVSEINTGLGEDSDFARRHGYYGGPRGVGGTPAAGAVRLGDRRLVSRAQ